MNFRITTADAIPEIRVLTPERYRDARGHLSEVYSRRALAEAGITMDFVQENESLSTRSGTVRGLHFQREPHAQAKLVRVVAGAVLDVAVDLRRAAPTFGRHAAVELSADEGNQVLVPAGFAHGFCTLAPDTVVLYRLSGYYAPEAEAGLRWDDPALGIDWPVAPAEAVLSDRDRAHPTLAELEAVFP